MSTAKPLRVAMYVRVSTDSQTTDNQKRDLLKYIEARGWELVEIYEDKGKRLERGLFTCVASSGLAISPKTPIPPQVAF
jgi:hypothetical protein